MNNFHNNQTNIPLVNKYYYLYKKTNSYLKQFPKHERYNLGAKIQDQILEILTGIFTVNQLPVSIREDLLIKLNAKNETLKLLFRLANETGSLELKSNITVQSYCQETGKMIGGWIKYLKSQR